MSDKHLQEIESNEGDPKSSTLARLSTALGVEVGELFRRVDKALPPRRPGRPRRRS